MKVLVTGANGFLGSHLVDRLLAREDEVRVLVRKSSNLRWLLDKPVRYHYGDVAGNLKGLREGLQGVEVVFHVAGVIRAKEKKTYYEVNAGGTARLLEACLEENPGVKRVVVVTSIAAHGPNLDAGPAREEDECHPITDYGKSKRDAELITLRYLDRLPVVIIRPPAIYGPRDEQVLALFRMMKRGVAPVLGRGRRVVALAHVQDVVTGLLLAAHHPKAVGEIFFVGDDRNYDWAEVIEIVGQVLGKRPIKIPIPAALVYALGGIGEAIGRVTGRIPALNLAYARNFLQPNWGMDVAKAKRLLGFKPAYPLTRGVEETVAWYQKEGCL